MDFRRVLFRARPCKLLMVGEGPERANYEKLCRGLGIVDDVRYLGKQDAGEEILSVSDLFLRPSEAESFGLAALEAMACKVPVVATNVGGIPELIVNGITGFMSNVVDVDRSEVRRVGKECVSTFSTGWSLYP